MKIGEIISFLESLAHPTLQESYDNAGLLTGDVNWICSGIICSLDANEEVVNEAIARGCNLVVSHHPIIFQGLKKITGKNYVERTVIAAIKHDIALYAIHTNLDNVLHGVNGYIGKQIGLKDLSVLLPKTATLKKIYTYVPSGYEEAVRKAIFSAGGGEVGNYSECSFNVIGQGTFKAGPGTNPFVGEQNIRHSETETKLEIIFPSYLENRIISALRSAHPYEEVAFEVIQLSNHQAGMGSGAIGELEQALEENVFLDLLKKAFDVKAIRHTSFLGRPVKKVAVCGGAGSFLISRALAEGADAFVSSDFKYHEFFDADGKMLIIDIGHFESEQFTIIQLCEVFVEKFLTLPSLKQGSKPTRSIIT